MLNNDLNNNEIDLKVIPNRLMEKYAKVTSKEDMRRRIVSKDEKRAKGPFCSTESSQSSTVENSYSTCKREDDR